MNGLLLMAAFNCLVAVYVAAWVIMEKFIPEVLVEVRAAVLACIFLITVVWNIIARLIDMRKDVR